jgi:hypothetical protein
MIILVWLLIAYGMTNILVYGSIFQGLRDWLTKMGNREFFPFNGVFKFISDLVSCMMCTSTWVGFFLSLVFYSPSQTFFGHNDFISLFFDGMLASGFVWAFNGMVEWFEENRPTKN